jgi:hypothetical protein
MKRDHENAEATNAELSATYRALATEVSPPRLDAEIRREAARRPGEQRGSGRRHIGLKPLALAATLVLGFAVILQLGDSEPPVPAAGGAATSASEAIRDPAAATGAQNRRIDNRGGSPLPGTAGLPADLNSRLPPNADCSAAQRAESGRWWQCIKDLERRGLRGAAETELRALLAAHPGFAAPR